MNVPTMIPAVWVHTSGDVFNSIRPGGYANFLTPQQQVWVERVRQARMLFDGKHREYFLTEQRTQFDFARARVGDREIQPYVKYNALKLVAIKSTDLLLGAFPDLTVTNPYQREALKAMAERTSLHPLLMSCAASAAYEAAAFIEACVFDGEVYLQQVPADEIFPVGALSPSGQYREYVRYSLKNIGTEKTPIYLLREIHYLPGKITRAVWQLGGDGNKQNQVELSAWVMAGDGPPPPPASYGGADTGPVGIAGVDPSRISYENPSGSDPIAGQELEAVTLTGIDRNTITWIPNELSRGQAISDFDIALELQDALNAKNTQLANILAKHADPNMAFPQESANPSGNMGSAYKMHFFSDPERIPKYITWDAQTKAAYDDREFVLNGLLVETETPPILLGIKSEHAHDAAYKTVKVQAMTGLKKAQRKSVYWAAGIKRALSVAQDLECAVIPGISYVREPLGVDLNDGFPVDEIDQANQISILRGAGVISLKRSVRMLSDDPEVADEELAELQRETAAATPSIFLGKAMPGNAQINSDLPGEEQAAAEAAMESAGEEVAA